MISISVANESEFYDQIKAWKEAAEKKIAGATKGIASLLFKDIIWHGPQFSGDFVANIKVGINKVNTSFQHHAINDSKEHWVVRHEGDRKPMTYAIAHAEPVLATYKFGDEIYISSNAKHDQGYSFLIENNAIAFRPENPSGGATFANALGRVKSKYALIDAYALQRLTNTSLLV